MRPQPLRRWLALRTAWVAALPLAMVGLLVWFWLAPQIRADFEVRHQALVRAIAGQIETYLLGAEHQLNAVAGLTRSLGDASPQLLDSLDAHVGGGAVFEAIYVADPGSLVRSVGLSQSQRARREDLIGLDLSRRDFLRRVRERREAVWSEVFLSTVTGRLAVALAVPSDRNTIVGEIDVDPLSSFLSNLPGESDLSVMILDQQGQVIARSQSAPISHQLNLSHLPLVGDALHGRFGTQSFEFEGKPLVGTVVGVPHVDWIVLLAQPGREAFQRMPTLMMVMAAGVGIALLAATLAGWMLARSFARRFDRYTGLAHMIANGDYDQPLPTSRISEFAALGSDLQRMTGAIHEREQALRASETRFRDLLEMASDWFWEQDDQFRFTYISAGSPALQQAQPGFDPPSFVGQTRFEMPIEWTPQEAAEHRATLEAHQAFRDLEYCIRLASGARNWFSINGEPRFDDMGRFIGYRGTGRDITARKEAESRIHHLAYFDTLTDLPNRSLLAQRAKMALAFAARHETALAVLFLDLDRFKEVNDSLGHAEGDTLLVQVAARLKALIRAEDTVCRLGGDEFVLLLPEADQDGASRVAEKVLASFSQPFDVGGHRLGVAVSIGIALYPHDGTTFTELLKNADSALFQAKREGRSTRVFYDKQMNMAAYARLVLETELRQAAAVGQFLAYYQPKVRLSDGALVGAEALIRWPHPERGLVPPGQFIPVAEASNLIVDLGEWMLNEVCRQLAEWRRQGLPPLKVAINLAPRHFRRAGLAEHIAAVLAAHALPPSALELELTESTLFETNAQTDENLLHLEQLGVGIALDDFGTGYSSLNYLKRLPLTALKIDQSFVRDLETDLDDRTIAATIVALGHHLNLEVVAEGVETDEQRRLLLAQGCDLAQGYLFDRPTPAAAFASSWLASAQAQHA